MRNQLRRLVGDKSNELIDLYRKVYPRSTPSDTYFLIASDYRFGGATMKAAERRAALGRGPAHLYYWTWESPLDGASIAHSIQLTLSFVFDNVKASRLTAGAPDAQALADKVSEAFIAFFRTGDPDTPKSMLPPWPKYEPVKRPTMVFNDVPMLEDDPIREQRLAIWDVMGLVG